MPKWKLAGTLEWLGLVFALGACASRAPIPPSVQESAPPLVPTAPEPGPMPGPEASKTTAEVDTSLTWPVYRAAGVPDIGRSWSVEDYRGGLRAFGKMLGAGRADLPRHESGRSGSVFARLVAPDNFRPIAEATATEERARLGESYLSIFPGLLQLYSPANDGLDFAAEQGELIVALLELLKSALDASRSFAAEDAGWSDTYDQQKTVAVGVLLGVNAMLAEEGRYSPALLGRLKGEVSRLGPVLTSHLDAERRRLVPRFY